MKTNYNFKKFQKKHKNKINQIIFSKEKISNKKIFLNLINNVLTKNNSFIFESVEKGKIRGRYTIVGLKPDKVWELNKKKILLIEKTKKKNY